MLSLPDAVGPEIFPHHAGRGGVGFRGERSLTVQRFALARAARVTSQPLRLPVPAAWDGRRALAHMAAAHPTNSELINERLRR